MSKTPLYPNYLDTVNRVLGVKEQLGSMKMIDAIPTSNLRNAVTDLNINALLLQPHIEEEIK